ncbi:hypothetical protein [uncultured Methanomethylovorans sp.]|nr:hypothetical protein [uncultured Methanomethylovorans sp.]
MPKGYGSDTTCRRLKRWSEEGILNGIMESLRDSAYNSNSFWK